MIVILVLALLELYIIRKRPYLGMFCFLFNLSIGAVINTINGSTTSILTFCVFIFLAIERVKQEKITRTYFLRNSIFFIVPLLLYITNVYDTNGFLNTEYVLIVIPSIVVFSMFFMRKYNVDFIDYYYKYIYINIGILLYRAFVDYTFFGYMINAEKYQNYISYYTAGGFRPANLTSPIIFSIEVAAAIYLMLAKYGPCRKTILFTSFSLVALLFMRSRSSLILLLIFIIYTILFSSKKASLTKGILITVLIISSFIAAQRFGLLDLITFRESSYLGRFSSVTSTLQQFRSFSLPNYLFGKGMGTANRVIDGNMQYYVENFFVALTIDLGIVGLLVFSSYIFTSLFLGINKNRSACVIVVLGICIVNIFASNLTSYLIQGLLWMMVLYAKYDGEDNLYEGSFGWIKR